MALVRSKHVAAQTDIIVKDSCIETDTVISYSFSYCLSTKQQ